MAAWIRLCSRAVVLACVVLPALVFGRAEAQDLARGREVFNFCASCHGKAGEGNRAYAAPAIAGLPTWYVEAQLSKFKQGLRAYSADDVAGLRMRPMARALVTADDLKSVAAYVATLPPPRPAATVQGEAARGQAAFATCAACHGPQALGNEAMGAPPLAHQADWYLVAQLEKFRGGLRGAREGDTTGARMRPMAMTLPNEQAIDDVVAYIRSLAR